MQYWSTSGTASAVGAAPEQHRSTSGTTSACGAAVEYQWNNQCSRGSTGAALEDQWNSEWSRGGTGAAPVQSVGRTRAVSGQLSPRTDRCLRISAALPAKTLNTCPGQPVQLPCLQYICYQCYLMIKD